MRLAKNVFFSLALALFLFFIITSSVVLIFPGDGAIVAYGFPWPWYYRDESTSLSALVVLKWLFIDLIVYFCVGSLLAVFANRIFIGARKNKILNATILFVAAFVLVGLGIFYATNFIDFYFGDEPLGYVRDGGSIKPYFGPIYK